MSGGPLLVLIAGGPGAAAAAGVLFAATLLVRAPVFLLQGVQASLLPSLTTFRARGDEASLHRATVKVALMLAGFAGVLAAGALVAGPFAMTLLYGDEFTAGRVDLALLCVGIGGFMAAGVFCQAALARSAGVGGRARAGAPAPSRSSALELALPGTAVPPRQRRLRRRQHVAGLLLMRPSGRSAHERHRARRPQPPGPRIPRAPGPPATASRRSTLAGLFVVLAAAELGRVGRPHDGHRLRPAGRRAHRGRRAAVRRLQLLLRPRRPAAARRHLRRHRGRHLAGRRARARAVGDRHRA